MDRITLIQEIFKNTGGEKYLEIGCQKGRSFLPVKAKYKTAVDPCFKITLTRKLKWLLKLKENIHNKYFEETSDDFFMKREKHLNKMGKLDVVLVDGLHTFRASLKDVLNSLRYLDQKGIIIMHDCLPPHKAAALPTKSFPNTEEKKAAEGWTGEWCGDVWKTIVYLSKALPGLVDVYVINTDFGLGIVRPKREIDPHSLSINEEVFYEVDKLTYEDLMMAPELLLNLKDPEYTKTIITGMIHQN